MNSYKDILDDFFKYFDQNTFSGEVEQGKKEYFDRIGRVFEDDSFFEARMSSFFEWFIFERPVNKIGLVPFELYYRSKAESLGEEQRKAAQDLLKNVWSVFFVKKHRENTLKLVDLFDERRYAVKTDRELYLAQSKIIEARLMPDRDEYYLSDTLFTYPREVTKQIKKQAKKARCSLRKDFHDFIFDLGQKSIKTHRYKHLPVEKIYVFN